jgi:hypothetical protein
MKNIKICFFWQTKGSESMEGKEKERRGIVEGPTSRLARNGATALHIPQ